MPALLEGDARGYALEFRMEHQDGHYVGVVDRGLGLPIVRGIVEAQGGTVDVKSTTGEGTIFSFTIPAAS